MQLLALTPAEIAFLAAPAAPDDALAPRLARKLALVLSARLRMPVELTACAPIDVTAASTFPNWTPDSALATLWLTRRLGGQGTNGATTAFVPRSLLRCLDAALAECWLDAPPPPALPAALAWRLASGATAATLGLFLPQAAGDMTRWAHEVIRRG